MVLCVANELKNGICHILGEITSCMSPMYGNNTTLTNNAIINAPLISFVAIIEEIDMKCGQI